MTQSNAPSASDTPLPSPKERRRLREAKSLSEQEVAAAVGVTRATVRAWETGRSEPRGRRREAYARLLGCTGPAAPTGAEAPGPGAGAEAPGPGVEGGPGAGAEGGPGAEGAVPAAASAGAPDTAAGQAAARTRSAGPRVRRRAGARATAKAAARVETPARVDRPALAPAHARVGGESDHPAPEARQDTGAPGPGSDAGLGSGTGTGTGSTSRSGAGSGSGAVSRPGSGGGSLGGRAPEKPERPHSLTRPEPAAKRAPRPLPPHPPKSHPPVAHPAPRPEPPERAREETRKHPPAWAERDPEQPPRPGEPTPAEAFDALYAYAAPALVRQAFLLSGRRGLSHEAVERAFHTAWQNWPEVARDRDPVGWVRAAAYEFAMSPWQRLRPAHRHPDVPPLGQEQRALLDALLELPPPYRRTLVLYDGLGLDLPETAAETEASTPAAANRVLHARQAIARRLPKLDTAEALQAGLAALTEACPVPQPAPARSVREGSERLVWFWTRTALTVTALIIGATGFTLATAPSQYEPEVAPGRRVEGIPAHAGPQRLTDQGRELREKLLSEPVHGPERLVPRIP